MSDATLSQVNRLLELIARENDPKNFLQRLNESWGAVQQLGRGKAVRDSAVLVDEANPYASEKTTPRLKYPRGWQPKNVEQQVEILREFYPMLDVSMVGEIARSLHVPSAADGLFVVPKLSAVASDRIDNPYNTNYGVMVESVLRKIAEKRALKNWREGQLGATQLRLRETTLEALQRLEKQTEGDYLVFPAQTGRKYAGYSVCNSRWEIEHNTPEFCLEAWCGTHILLTHPERLTKNTDSFVDLPGTEYSLGSDCEFGNQLYFLFSVGRLHFTCGLVSYVSRLSGSASGFAS